MPAFGKPNATGRSSGKLSGRERRINLPPEGEPWCWLTRELLTSPSWLSRSINCRRLIDFLLIEGCNHAGRENGALKATYDQLELFGLSRRLIRSAITEAEFLGLICTEYGGYFGGVTECSEYRLTFYADRNGNPPTNEWKRITDEKIKAWYAENRLKKNRSSVNSRALEQVNTRALDGVKIQEQG